MPRKIRRRTLPWLLGALALLASVACVIAGVPGPDGAPRAVVANLPGANHRDASIAAAKLTRPAVQRLLIVGASYTQGLGARPQTAGYAYLLGQQLGWPTTVAGVAGTGFLNPGPHDEGTYPQRIGRLPSSLDPGLVLLQCGRNDLGYSARELTTAITGTVDLVRRRYVHAEVVMLGAIPGNAPIEPGLDTLQRTLSAAARSLDVPFIDPIEQDWITKHDVHGYTGAVAQHPNDAGYAFIADHVLADLYRLSDGQIGTAHPHVRPGSAGGPDGPGDAGGAPGGAGRTAGPSTSPSPSSTAPTPSGDPTSI